MRRPGPPEPFTFDQIKQTELMSMARHIERYVPEALARERIGATNGEQGRQEAVLEAPDAFKASIRESGPDGP